jgi:hypothetical protein
MLASLTPPEDKIDVSIQEVLQEIEREGQEPPPPPPSCLPPAPMATTPIAPIYAPQPMYFAAPQMYAPPPASRPAVPRVEPPASKRADDGGVLGMLKKHETSILLVLLYFGFSFLKLGNLLNVQNLTLLQRVPSSMIGIKAILFVLTYNLLKKNMR